MNNFTTNTYEMKRDIVKFSKKICKNSNKPESKLVTDMIYGINIFFYLVLLKHLMKILKKLTL